MTIGDAIVVLRRGYRFGGGIATLAEAVRRGDADAALTLLRAGGEDVRWIDADAAERATPCAPVREPAVAAGRRRRRGRPRRRGAGGARRRSAHFRLLCAHRRGPYGVATWNARRRGLARAATARSRDGAWYVGRPLLVTQNDYGLRLFNGDTGVVVARRDGGARRSSSASGELVRGQPGAAWRRSRRSTR